MQGTHADSGERLTHPLPTDGGLFAPDLIPLPLLSVDGCGRIRDCNERAEEELRCSRQRLRGRRLDALFGPAGELHTLLARAAATERVSHAGIVHRGDGAPWALHAGPDGIGGALLVMVPEARRSEAQLLQRRYATAEAVARIALELAHEVKNPLAALRGTAQWMAERQTHAAIEEGCARLLAEFDRIRERIDAFLQLAPRAALSMESVNIHALIHDVCRPVPEGVELRLVLDPSLPELSAHGARLRQALENLWRNALEAHARTIEIETRVAQGGTLPGHKGPVLQICFRSDGDPIPEAIRPQLFDPFVTGKDGGSGLGLAIVQRVLQEHGGHIRLADDRHHTRFILHLPIRRTHNPERCA